MLRLLVSLGNSMVHEARLTVRRPSVGGTAEALPSGRPLKQRGAGHAAHGASAEGRVVACQVAERMILLKAEPATPIPPPSQAARGGGALCRLRRRHENSW